MNRLNKETRLVRVKTMDQLHEQEPTVEEYFDDTLDVFDMLSKYAGKKIYVYSTGNKDSYRSEVIDNDENLKLLYGDRVLYESEIEGIGDIFKLNQDLFEL